MTEGGIVLPPEYSETLVTGIVHRVSCDAVYDTPPNVTLDVGNRVMLARQIDPRNQRVVTHPTVEEDGIEYSLVNYADILLKITDVDEAIDEEESEPRYDANGHRLPE